MTKEDVNRIYTEKVSELLAQGYQIHTSTMGGSQGDIAHIDLSNGTEILRVYLESIPGFGDSYDGYLTLTVGRNTDRIRNGWSETVWNEHLEVLFQIKFAKVTNDFFTTPEESARMFERRMERYAAHASQHRRELGDAYKSVALRWVQKQPRMKGCRLDEIESVTRVNKTTWGKALPDLYCYEIKARGKVFQLKRGA